MTEFERIRGRRYSSWCIEGEYAVRELKGPDAVGIAVWLAVLLVVPSYSWMCARLVVSGSALARPALLLFLFGWVPIMFLVILFMKLRGSKRDPAKVEPPPRRPNHVPMSAVPVRMTIRGNQNSLGRAEGWLWIERPHLMFWSPACAFRLPKSMIEDHEKATKQGRSPFTLHPQRLSKTLRTELHLSTWHGSAKEDEAVHAILSNWGTSYGGEEGALLPPVRPMRWTIPWGYLLRMSLVNMVYAGLLCGLTLYLVRIEMPPEVKLNPWLGFFVGVYFPLIFLSSPLETASRHKSHDAAVDNVLSAD